MMRIPNQLEASLGLLSGDSLGVGMESEIAMQVFLAVFVLLGILLAVQIRRWLIRRSPRARSHQLVAEAAGDTVFELDLLSRRIWLQNPEGMGLGGVESSEDLQIGTNFDRVHPDDREELRNGWDRLARGEKLDLQIRFQDAGGGWVWFHLSAVSGRNRGARNTRGFGVIRHTNNLHQRQETLAEARRLETLGTIAGGIAHEFNNHLTPVRGYLELALDDLPSGTPTYDGLKTALERVIHCSELVSQIQAYGRKSLMILRPADLTELLPGVAEMVTELETGRPGNIRLVQDWPDRLPEVELDTVQFKKALKHLIRNAVEAMPNGGALRVQAREMQIKEADCYPNRDATPGHRVMVQIADTGIGIPEVHLNQVMDPFFTTHGRASARGMGLPMVQGMMAQLGGWMDVRSAEGFGTTIKLFFPACSNILPTAAQGANAGFISSSIPAAEMGRLLIADDETFVREIARKIFEGENWTVEEASDFHEVTRRCTNPNKPPLDVILLDLVMPGPTAEETIHIIRTVYPGVRILLMSGFSRDNRVNAMTREPGVEYIAKPFSTRELLQKIEGMMCATDLDLSTTP